MSSLVTACVFYFGADVSDYKCLAMGNNIIIRQYVKKYTMYRCGKLEATSVIPKPLEHGCIAPKCRSMIVNIL